MATPIDPGFVTTVDVPTPNTVLVQTFSTAGAAVDRTFSLQVAC